MLVLVAGCATQDALRDARESYAQGRVEESLARLQAALTEKPGDTQLRLAYLSTRERAVSMWMDKAGQARRNGDLKGATGYYQRVLIVDAGNAQARSSLVAIETDERNTKLLTEARDALGKHNEEVARAKLRAILSSDPEHSKARDLLRKLDAASGDNLSEPQLSAALQKTLSIDFVDASLRQVFEVLARTSSLNFVFDRDLKTDQKTTVFLKGTTVKDAINVVLMTNQLEQRVLDGSTLLIYPNTPAKQKDYQKLVVKSFFLASADAEQVANTLKTILKTRDVVVDKKQNMLIMRDSPEAVQMAEKLVNLHDLPEPEVMLEVEVLEVNRTRLTELGVKFPQQLSLTPLPSGTALTLNDVLHPTANRVGAAISPMLINARGESGEVNLLANPRIRARNRETAKILIGDRVPNITSTSTSTGFVSENVQYLDVGLKLDVTPVISVDNEIAIKVALEVSSIADQIKTSTGTLAYQIGTRTASTVLRLKDGENQVLAGLINDEDRHSSSKVPLLGDIPVAGRLFSSHLNDTKKTEIVLSITPRLVRNTPRPMLSELEFNAGTENSLRSTGARASGDGSTGVESKSDGMPVAGVSTSAPLNSAQSAGAGTQDAASLGTEQTKGGNQSSSDGAPAGARWQGPSKAKVGETVSLQLFMQSPETLSGLAYAVAFDPRAIEVVSVNEGDLLKQGGPTTFNQRIDKGVGQIFITQARSVLPASTDSVKPGPGSGVAATLLLKPLASGAAQFQVTTLSPYSVSGSPINIPTPQAMTITVTP